MDTLETSYNTEVYGPGISVSFYEKYQLERLVAEGPAKTFRAQENGTGRPVLVHMCNPDGKSLFAALEIRFRNSRGEAIAPLIETGEFGGYPYAVTEAVEPFTSLGDWLALGPGVAPAAKPPVRSVPPPAPPPVPARDQPGEFTRLFKMPPAAPPVRGPQPKEAGEFTRMFHTPPAPAASPEAKKPAEKASPGAGEFTKIFAVKPPSGSPKPPASGESSEFNRMFNGGLPKPLPVVKDDLFGPAAASPDPAPPATGAMPTWPAPAPRSAMLDEFDRITAKAARPSSEGGPQNPWPAAPQPLESELFESGMAAEQIDIEAEQAQALRAPMPESRPFQQASDFTRMFGPPVGSKTPSSPQTPAAPSSSASGIFGTKERPLPQSPEPELPKPPEGPGEYTRMIMSGRREPAVAAPVPVAAPPAAPAVPPATQPNRHKLIVGGIIGFAVLLMLIALLTFLLRRH